MPAETLTTPTRPPTSAWDDDAGRPNRQVIRFHAIAPPSPDSTIVSATRSGRSEVRRLEREGDGLKALNIDTLNRSFSTPYDREDIYRAIIAIDDSVNYAKTTVREMEILEVSSDLHTLEMAGLLRQGAMALRAGFAKLKLDTSEAEQDADAVRKAERQVEEAYRRALAELFDMERYLRDRAKRHEAAAKELATPNETTERRDCPADVAGLSFVLEALKRREIYRHLSNASDRIAFAADILHDIVVKSS